MILLAYYDRDPVGHNTVDLLEPYLLEATHVDKFKIVQLSEAPIYATESELPKAELVMFISKHSSAKGVTSFTVHSCGNWGESADLGGKPKALCRSDPIAMWKLLNVIKKENRYEGVAVTYEATHHGPLIEKPCLFVEVGGNEAALKNKDYASVLAKSIRRAITEVNQPIPKVAIGIGGTHYPEKFTRMALNDGVAFSYIMSRYNVANTDMLNKAVSMSTTMPEFAAIEWKSIKADERKKVIDVLDAIGLRYERI